VDCTIGLEVNGGKTKYTIMSQNQNAGQSHKIKTKKSFESIEQFKYLGTTLMYQNSVQEESKSRLKSGNACYHLMQDLLLSSLLSNNIKIKISITITLPVVLYGCQTWSLMLNKERSSEDV